MSSYWNAVIVLVRTLRRIDDQVNLIFEDVRCRKPELADKQQKIIEEVGEVIDAINHGKKDSEIIDEIWDSVIAALCQAFILGYSNDAIMKSLSRTLRKLDKRWPK